MSELSSQKPLHTLHYGTQVKAASWIVLLSFLVFSWAAIDLARLIQEQGLRGRALTEALHYGVWGVIFLLQYLFLLRPLASSVFLVFEDRLEIQRGSNKRVLHFSDILVVKSAIKRGIGGWFKVVMRDGSNQRFFISLRNVHEILDAAWKANPAILAQDKYEHLRVSLILNAQALGRARDMMKFKRLAVYLSQVLLLPVLFSFTLLHFQLQQFKVPNEDLVWVLTGLNVYVVVIALWLGCFIWVEFRAHRHGARRLAADPKAVSRDLSAELSIRHQARLAYVILLLGFLGVYAKKDLNAYLPSFASNNAEWINLRKFDFFWLDTRYSCVDCQYSLRMGDPIQVRFGKWVAVGSLMLNPGQELEVTAHAVNTEGRIPASTHRQTVRADEVYIQTGGQGELMLILPKSAVLGKIVK